MSRSLLLSLTLIVATACGQQAASTPVAIDDRRVPFGLLGSETAATTTTTTPTGSAVRLCYVDPEGFLQEVPERLDLSTGPVRAVRALARPRGELATSVPDPAPVRSVKVQGGVAAVDLVPRFGELGTQPQQLAIAQIVCTLTSLPGIGQVSFALDGSPVDVPDASGALTPGPVSRDHYATLLARVR